MNIGERLKAVGSFVISGCVLADIGTDHAYLPVFLLQEKQIAAAIAGDIAQGPCKAAEATVAMYGMKGKVQVRLGSGLSVLKEGEAQCISIAGMGGSTMVEILQADLPIALAAQRLVLQPQTGALGLRKWLLEHGWSIVAEDLVWENKRLYEIVAVERRASDQPVHAYSVAELEIGPLLVANRHPLLKDQFAKQLSAYYKQLGFMEKSASAVKSDKYLELKQKVLALEGLAHECKLE